MTEIVKGLNDIRNFFDKKVKSDMDDAIYAAQEALNAAAIGSSKIAGGVRGAKQTLVDEFEDFRHQEQVVHPVFAPWRFEQGRHSDPKGFEA